VRILALTSNFPVNEGHYYGHFILKEYQALADRGHTIYVVTASQPSADDSHIASDKIHVQRFWWPQGHTFRTLHEMGLKDVLTLGLYQLSAFISGIRTIMDVHPDIIYTQSYPLGLNAIFYRLFLGIPYVLNAQGTDITGATTSLRRYILKIIFRFSNGTVTQSEFMRTKIRDLFGYECNVAVLHSCIDPSYELLQTVPDDTRLVKVPTNKNIVLFVGMLHELKGIFELAHAFKALSLKDEDAYLVYVGDGRDKDRLHNLLHELDIENRVTCAGMVPHDRVSYYFANATLFCLPSCKESGSPTYSTLEAIQFGVPVVCCKKGGNAEIFTHGRDAMLIDPSDEKEFSSCLRMLLNDSDLRISLSQNAKKLITKNEFTWQYRAERISELFLSVLE